MADDPNWTSKTPDQKIEFLKLWAENMQAHIRGLDQNVQLVLEKLRRVEATSKGAQNDDAPRA